MAQLGLTLPDLSPCLLHIQGPWGSRCHLVWGHPGRQGGRDAGTRQNGFWTWHTCKLSGPFIHLLVIFIFMVKM